MTLPMPYLVDHYPWDSTSTDELGNAVPSYPDTPTKVPVAGWEIISSEQLGVHATEERFDASLIGPPNWLPGIRDRIELPTGMFEVVGHEVRDGFVDWKLGSVTLLKRVLG